MLENTAVRARAVTSSYSPTGQPRRISRRHVSIAQMEGSKPPSSLLDFHFRLHFVYTKGKYIKAKEKSYTGCSLNIVFFP